MALLLILDILKYLKGGTKASWPSEVLDDVSPLDLTQNYW